MKLISRTMVVLAVCACMSGSAFGDLWISFDSVVADDLTLTTPFTDAIVDNFDSDRPEWTYSGNGAVVSGSLSGSYAPPYNSINNVADPTQYYTVPGQLSDVPGSALVEFGADYAVLGLFWGSIDTYNSIEFFRDNQLVATVTGSLVSNDPDGNWTAPGTNTYVNIGGVGMFDAVRFNSTIRAFEFDNLAVVVPIPAAVVLGMLGLGVAGVKLRKYV